MDADTFEKWLGEMRMARLAKSDADCARLLGKHPDTVARYKSEGCDRTTALACRALVHRMEPYA